MKLMKLATKITFIVVLAISLVMVSTFAYLVVRERNKDISNAYSNSEAIAKENAAAIKAELEVALDSARVLAQSMSAFESFPLESRREILSGIVRQIAQDNEKFLGAWVCFEPNALDGLDETYANQEGYDQTGRFIPNWYREENGLLLSPLVDYDKEGAGDYYLTAFKSGQESVLNPYAYEISGKSVLLTSFSVPVKNAAGQIVGVAGVDVSLDTLNTMSFSKGSYRTTNVYLLAHSGSYVIHSDSKAVGANIEDIEPRISKAQEMLGAIQTGKAYTTETMSEITNEESLKTMVPVTLGKTITPWSLGVSVSMKEITAESQANMLMLICVSLVVIGIISIVTGFSVTRLVKKPLTGLVQVAQQQAKGDYAAQIQTNRHDELGTLYASMMAVNDNMNELLSNLKNAAEQVATGAKQISDTSMELAQGATEQASSIEQLTASIEQISSQTKVNVDHADQANALAVRAKEYAEKGNTQMGQLLTAMEEINESSGSISGIIKVIDDIAFQTNILALNAAVEAARAGQNGKGFAVVAEEVRNLAARSAQAASEITVKIEESIKKVDGGSKIADMTAQALKSIVSEISQAANLVNDIMVASNEQASGITQINQGIQQVTQVIQANSSSSQQSAAASEELSGQAQVLKEQVSHFKLRGK